MRIDLHIHSAMSDGQLSPGAVAEAAAAGGLDTVALTDHDTVLGFHDAWEVGRELGVQVIPGIEVSTRHGPQDLHILGYWIDPDSAAMQEHQHTALHKREHRMHRMVERLQEMGIPVQYSEVVAVAGPQVKALGRPHLARALLAGGHTRYYAEAFDRYLYDGGPAFVLEPFPTVPEAIEMIHAAGGVAVWAHPPLELFDAEIRRMVSWGLDGVECFRPTLPPAESLLLETATRELGLFPTGGSDWHGPYRSRLGDFYIRPHEVREFLEVGARTL